ncbi:MAG: hypothetical protein AAF936_10935 [Pseudomonadota bacterium]
MNAARTILAAVLMLAIGACGFKPIYATPEGQNSALNQRIAVRSVVGSQTINPMLTEALYSRMSLKEGEAPQYDLYVTASERAQRLAVQIDNTTTRYNYRLRGRYTLIDLSTGKRIRGRAEAVTSYNIVSSQYSTLFAERTAQEKAARILAEEIERDLLLRFSEETVDDNDTELPDYQIDPRTNTLTDPDLENAVPDPFTAADPKAAVPDPLLEEEPGIEVSDPDTDE